MYNVQRGLIFRNYKNIQNVQIFFALHYNFYIIIIFRKTFFGGVQLLLITIKLHHFIVANK